MTMNGIGSILQGQGQTAKRDIIILALVTIATNTARSQTNQSLKTPVNLIQMRR